MSEDNYQTCPKCKTSTYRNPSMKLMVNVCGHTICESCVDLLFAKGSGACTECDVPLRRNNFRFQLFEDAQIDKQVDIRRKILRDFNKKEDDFESVKAFNDYLEMIEDLIFNLTNNVDIVETNRKISEYKEINKEFIVKNRSKLSRDQIVLRDIIEVERKQKMEREKMDVECERLAKLSKIEKKEQLIRDLISSEDATDVINKHSTNNVVNSGLSQKSTTENANYFKQQLDNLSATSGAVSQKAHMSASDAAAATSSASNCCQSISVEDKPFVYTSPIYETNGPPLEQNVSSFSLDLEKSVFSAKFEPHFNVLTGLYSGEQSSASMSKYHVKSGGFKGNLCALKTIEEGMNSLFFNL